MDSVLPEPCRDFVTRGGFWVTATRLAARGVQADFESKGGRFIAVLIGSLLRSPYPLRQLDGIWRGGHDLEWRMFVATADMGSTPSCLAQICSLQHLESISWVDLLPESQSAEDDFARRAMNSTKSDATETLRAGWGGSLRQLFKLARAYELMESFEQIVGRRFDAVLRTRSDLLLLPPLDLRMFTELSSRVVYSVGDVVFLSSRQVAAALLDGLLERSLDLVGTDDALLPINYDQLLDSDLEDVDFFLLNYPCTRLVCRQLCKLLQHCEQTRGRGVGTRVPRWVASDVQRLIRVHRSDLEAAHRPSSSQLPWPTCGPSSADCSRLSTACCSGAWWRNETALQWHYTRDLTQADVPPLPGANGRIESTKAWFYLVHSLKPQVIMRKWPGGGQIRVGDVHLHPHRHYSYCYA